MSSPKDCAGRVLEVGQKVAYQGTGGFRGLHISTITKINPKTVTLAEPRPSWQSTQGGITRPFNSLCVIPEVFVTSERFEKLQGDSNHLNMLVNRGVDNWDGYVSRHHEDCDECGLDEDDCECGGDQ